LVPRSEIAVAYVGTLAWARETGGRIGFKDRRELIRLGALTAATDLPHYVWYGAGTKRRFPAPSDYGALKVPDTSAGKIAETLLGEVASPFMVNHSMRTYWFSRLIGVGWYRTRPADTADAQCFSIRSARWAIDIARNAGWDEARTNRLGEAIILNLNGRVPRSLGPEAHLMMRGVMVDVTGLHAWRINPANLDGVFADLPLLDQRRRLRPLFYPEAERHPDCRAHFATRYLGFGLLMKHCPWQVEQ
jgi:hypothetical protein